jgi:hypothetical protein
MSNCVAWPRADVRTQARARAKQIRRGKSMRKNTGNYTQYIALKTKVLDYTNTDKSIEPVPRRRRWALTR